ncbi:uncharacterized protein P174DRAFT_181428 [Aspergillus novofumigatus IBT 16806]|uniref:Uncharacterized protein n=1 Tax=Aspergillus novofumigatus (strain IBT 16806) TaxID=1392255 RepID=A0A2I1C9V1_ASPN1|nr:uncharacterized protein P174DRAFT_181428 [Aspergillus novofumigatus IBT 16806]PKX94402.1 hypothetical protein P174DRAFT_181428 [Aspergillus novofumigatus IBT 16806]
MNDCNVLFSAVISHQQRFSHHLLIRLGFSFSVASICSVYIYIDTLFSFLLLTYTAVCVLCLFRMLFHYTRILLRYGFAMCL